METRANYIAVGAFTLAAIAGVFVILYWLGKYGDQQDMVPIHVRIQGSVSGLGKDSIVQFNGITVGRVTGLALDPEDPQSVIVGAEIGPDTPLRQDTKATIGIRGLSGGAFIQLEGGDKDSPKLLLKSDLDKGVVPLIRGDPAALSDLVTRVSAIAARTESVMGTLEKFIDTNETAVSQSLTNVEKFTEALASNSDGVRSFMASAGNVAVSLERLTKQLDGSIVHVEAIIKAIEPQKIIQTVENVETFTQSLADQRTQLTAVMTAVGVVVKELNSASTQLSSTMTKVASIVDAVEPGTVTSIMNNMRDTTTKANQVLSGVNPEELKSTIGTISKTADQVRTAVAAIEPNTIKELVTNMGAAGAKASKIFEEIDPEGINKAVTNVEKTAAQAEKILAAVDSEKIGGAVDNIASAAASAQQAMSGLNQAAINTLITDLSSASTKVAKLLDGIDPDGVNVAVKNFSKAADGAQSVVADVKKVTSGLGERSGDINQIVTDASQLAARLNASSAKIQSVIDRVDGVLGQEGSSNLVNEAEKTLVEIRRAAASLSGSVNLIAADVNSLTRRGLGDVQGLIGDARRSISSIDRVMRKIENNPSALISGAGGSRVREVSGEGRPRR